MTTPLNIEGIPEYNWIPPEWNGTKPNLTEDPLNQTGAEPVFNNPTALNGDRALADGLEIVKRAFPNSTVFDHVKCERWTEDKPGSETGAELAKIPHPGSDFSHVDPGTYQDSTSNNEKKKFLDAIQAVGALEVLAARDETMKESIQEALLPLRRAEGQLLKGPQRLTRVFENNLCKVTVLYGELSAGLDMGEPDGRELYNTARAEYLKLLQDLDDSEPKTLTPGKLGYGLAFKWAYIRPIIHDGMIKGAKIVAKWNPHLSSSGIPIPHK